MTDFVMNANAGRLHFCVPNFVDTGVFRPASDNDERAACRRAFGIGENAFVIGDVAAVKKRHKRIDYLIEEFAELMKEFAGNSLTEAQRSQGRNAERYLPFLVVAGARTEGSAELRDLAERLCPGQTKFLFDLSREQMPRFYRSLDVFSHAALFEMMPIAFLEALASGVPITCNTHPVMEWMVGKGGQCLDLEKTGGLARAWSELIKDQGRLSRMAEEGRRRAVREFSKEAVIPQMLEMYRNVLGSCEEGR